MIDDGGEEEEEEDASLVKSLSMTNGVLTLENDLPPP